jgi:hypothetical protein
VKMGSGKLVVSTAMVLLVLVANGCGGKTAAVEGQVKFKDGNDVSVLGGYEIAFEHEESKTSATGQILADGTFTITTFAPGDGALPGKHRVAITQPTAPDPDKPPQKSKVPEKYADFSSSGLAVEIKPGRNAVTLELERGGTP